MTLSDKQKLEYYERKDEAATIVVKDAREDKHIIYGARSLNAVLPEHLHKPTEDFDIFVKNPRAEAIETERKLDSHFKGDFFRTEPAAHKGTFRVQSNVTNNTIADYTKPSRKIDTVNIDGVKYASLKFNKQQIRRTLNDPSSSFRHKKDKESLQRIKLYEKFGNGMDKKAIRNLKKELGL